MRRSILAVAVLALGLAGCGSQIAGTTLPPVPKTAAQAVYEAEGAYAAALSLAVAYKELPGCAAGIVQACSDPAKVAKLRAADKTAWAALQGAQQVVLAANSSPSATTAAIASAGAAVAAFTAVTSTLGGN